MFRERSVGAVFQFPNDSSSMTSDSLISGEFL